MYFYNKLIWNHKCEYHALETWSNVNHFTWHATHSCISFGTEVVACLTDFCWHVSVRVTSYQKQNKRKHKYSDGSLVSFSD